MNIYTWTGTFFYGNIIILLIIFLILIDKKRLKALIPVGLFIGVENYTAEMLGLYWGYWEYPLKTPGYPEVTIISSLIYFPIIAMLFCQYLSNSKMKNIILIGFFVTCNMIIEIITLKTTKLFIYKRGMNLLIALIMYIGAYVLIILFRYFYSRLKYSKGS